MLQGHCYKTISTQPSQMDETQWISQKETDDCPHLLFFYSLTFLFPSLKEIVHLPLFLTSSCRTKIKHQKKRILLLSSPFRYPGSQPLLHFSSPLLQHEVTCKNIFEQSWHSEKTASGEPLHQLGDGTSLERVAGLPGFWVQVG